MQVNLRWWSHLLLEVDGGSLRGKLRTWEDYERYALCPAYNIEMGTKVFKHYEMMFPGRDDLALTAYWAGENSQEFHDLVERGIRNHYIDDILYEDVYIEKMKVLNKWRFIEKKKRIPQTNH